MNPTSLNPAPTFLASTTKVEPTSKAKRRVPSRPFTDLPSVLFDKQLDGIRVVIAIRDGSFSLVDPFEDQLAVTGNVGPFTFGQTPLDEAYWTLITAFLDGATTAIDQPDNSVVAVGLNANYEFFADTGDKLHSQASYGCGRDGGRLTTALTLRNNYLYTILQISLRMLGDRNAGGDTEIQLDKKLAGLQNWDGLGLPWGFQPALSISHVKRFDQESTYTYLAARDEDIEKNGDVRLNFFQSLLTDPSNIDFKRPSSVYSPIADAFRAKATDLGAIISAASTRLKEQLLQSRTES